MGRLSTHVLDTAHGCPAAGVRVTVYFIDPQDGADAGEVRLRSLVTNADGRTDGPILPRERFAPGVYELTFRAGDYLRASGAALTEPAFLDEVPIRFGMEAGHYHVPLLLSPFGYSTYRGS